MLAIIAGANGWITMPPEAAMAEVRGLAHLARPLRDLRRRHGDLPVLALGDWMSGAPAPSDSAPALLRIAAKLGVAVALPGERDLLRMLQRPAAWLEPAGMTWVASDLSAIPGAARHGVIQHNGLRIGVIGLTRPSVVAASQLRRAGVTVHLAAPSAREALSALVHLASPDLTIAVTNGAWDSAEEQITALVEDLPVRHGAQELADGGVPVDILIAYGAGRSHQKRGTVSVNTVPLIRVGPGLTRLTLTLERRNGRWRVTTARQEKVLPAEQPDAGILALAGGLTERTGVWLAAPTRAAVSGPSRKRDFIACAGALVHGAAAHAAGSTGPRISLLPHLWRYEPLRKRHIGQPITRGRLYRWMPHDDAILPARLTGRQISLMLEPWARHRSGWSVLPALVLHPGGIEPVISGRATQPEGVRSAGDNSLLSEDAQYLVWLAAYHAFGAGGLTRRALVQAGQLGEPLELPLREWVFRWMASPGFALPGPCRYFLAVHSDDPGGAAPGSPALGGG